MTKELFVYIDPDYIIGHNLLGRLKAMEETLKKFGIEGEVTGQYSLNRIDFKSMQDKNLALISLLEPAGVSKISGRQYYRFIV
jgi:hypothetical protein